MQESQRQQKFSRLIQKDLGEIFQKDIKSKFGNAFITITQVTMSPDLSLAKVYLSFMLVEDNKTMLDNIVGKKSEIRKMLGNKIGKQVRIVPDLQFFLDDTAEYASRIDHLLSGLDIPEEEDDEEEDTKD